MKKYTPVLIFLLRFFASYLILTLSYQWYLNKTQQKGYPLSCDPITKLVADQTVAGANSLGYHFDSEQHPDELSIKLFTDNKYTARIVEGCNSISIIILFWAFILAFKGSWSSTLLYGIIGSMAIYVINIARIIILTKLLDAFPGRSDFWHQIVFPAIIYGFTFILWIIWVRYFALTKNSPNA